MIIVSSNKSFLQRIFQTKKQNWIDLDILVFEIFLPPFKETLLTLTYSYSATNLFNKSIFTDISGQSRKVSL